MYCKTHTVVVATNGDGDGVGYVPVTHGRILQIRYVETDYADGVDLDVTLEDSGVVVWSEDDVNASKTVLPRQATHSTAGVAAQFSDGYPTLEPVVVAGERVKIAVADGGATKTGTFYVTIG